MSPANDRFVCLFACWLAGWTARLFVCLPECTSASFLWQTVANGSKRVRLSGTEAWWRDGGAWARAIAHPIPVRARKLLQHCRKQSASKAGSSGSCVSMSSSHGLGSSCTRSPTRHSACRLFSSNAEASRGHADTTCFAPDLGCQTGRGFDKPNLCKTEAVPLEASRRKVR